MMFLVLIIARHEAVAVDPIVVSLGNQAPVVLSCGHYLQINWNFDETKTPKICPPYDAAHPNYGGAPYVFLLYQLNATFSKPLWIIGYFDCDAYFFFWKVPDVLPAFFNFYSNALTALYKVAVVNQENVRSNMFDVLCPSHRFVFAKGRFVWVLGLVSN
jgi:hypothetical protein